MPYLSHIGETFLITAAFTMHVFSPPSGRQTDSWFRALSAGELSSVFGKDALRCVTQRRLSLSETVARTPQFLTATRTQRSPLGSRTRTSAPMVPIGRRTAKKKKKGRGKGKKLKARAGISVEGQWETPTISSHCTFQTHLCRRRSGLWRQGHGH